MSKMDPKCPVFSHHTTIGQAAKVFNEVQPKLAVYNHIVKPFERNEQELLGRTKANYSGPVMIGEDLMSFSIGDSVSVSTRRYK
jgi:ribonuclease Z